MSGVSRRRNSFVKIPIVLLVLCVGILSKGYTQVNVEMMEMFETTFSFNDLFEEAKTLDSTGRLDTLELLLTVVEYEAEHLDKDISYMRTIPMFSVGFMDFIFNLDVLDDFGFSWNEAIYMHTYATGLSRMTYRKKVGH